jgi:hypothetical protein
MHTGFWEGRMKKTDLLEDPSVDRRIINCILKEWDGRTWNRLMAQDWHKSRAVVNTVMNLRVP